MNPADRATRKLQSAASAYRPQPELDRLAQLRDDNPAEYEKLSTNLKMQLGYYLQAKAAAEHLGGDAS